MLICLHSSLLVEESPLPSREPPSLPSFVSRQQGVVTPFPLQRRQAGLSGE